MYIYIYVIHTFNMYIIEFTVVPPNEQRSGDAPGEDLDAPLGRTAIEGNPLL